MPDTVPVKFTLLPGNVKLPSKTLFGVFSCTWFNPFLENILIQFPRHTSKLYVLLIKYKMANIFSLDYQRILSESEKFNFDYFKTLTWPENLHYADETLPVFSDTGGGRKVFSLGNNKVLKIAKANNQKFFGGFKQNKNEVEIYYKLKNIDFFPEMYDYAKDYSWIIFEKVNLIGTETDALQPYTDLYFEELEAIFGSRRKFTIDQIFFPEKYPELQDEIEEITDFGPDWKNNEYIKKMYILYTNGIHPEELLVPSHYGINKNGKLVLVDFGL